MRKILCTIVALALLALPGTILAVDDVANTVHNLSTSGTEIHTSDGTDQVCVFCHTPHGAVSGDAPLWNRLVNTSGYTMYTSATIDMTIASQPQGVSQACLSCHDGTIAFDALINGPGAGDYDPTGASRGWTFLDVATPLGGNRMPAGEIVNLGQDLSNDHPISVTYDNSVTGDTAFNASSSVTGAGLVLYGSSTNQVECGSCHNPHDDTFGTFLRISNSGSALCTTCHIK
jgi:predicted CXXCH cytochrome family protein